LAPKFGCKRPSAAGKRRPARGTPALRVPSIPGGSHGSLWSGQTGAPRCAGPRGSPPAIRFLGRYGGVWACSGLGGPFPLAGDGPGVWYHAQAAAVAAAVVGATNMQIGAMVSTASLDHSNPFQVPPPGTRRTGNKQKRRRRYTHAPPIAGWTAPLTKYHVDAPSQIHRKGRTLACRVIVYRFDKHGNRVGCLLGPRPFDSAAANASAALLHSRRMDGSRRMEQRSPERRRTRWWRHMIMIGPTTWVQWTTVGSITTSAVLFSRLRGRARQGAFYCKSWFLLEIYNFDGGRIHANPLPICGEPHGLFLNTCPRPAPPTVRADTNACRAPLYGRGAARGAFSRGLVGLKIGEIGSKTGKNA
jgi:hypothetical protein